MEVVFKEGMLYLKGNKFGKKTWRKMWMVLYSPSIFGIGRVELYDLDRGHTTTNNTSKSKSPQGRRVVQLCDCLSVTTAPEESCPALPNNDCRAFYLNTTQRSYFLASENYHDWVGALCQLAFQKDRGHKETREKGRGDVMGIAMEENDLYATWKTAQYQVTVQNNEASRRCQLTGSYLLLPERDAILLQDLQTGVTVYCWPYHLLRRFGQVKGGFSIEAGRRCTSGEGQFTFLSKHAPQIYKAMEDALTLHREMDNEDTKTSTQPPSNSSSPQLPHSSSSPQHNSSSPKLPHPFIPHPPHSSSPPSTRTSSSSQHPSSSSSPHPPNRVHTRTLTDLSDRTTAPPLPMRNNLLPSPQIITPVTEQVLWPESMADSDCDLYATIEDHLLPRIKLPPAPLMVHHSLPLYKEEEEEEERCHSLDTVDLNKLGLGEGSPHYKLRRGIICRAEEKREKERIWGSSECVYALVSKPSQTQSLSMPNLSRQQFQAQLQGEEETGLGDSGGSGGSITPTGVPGSFKQKLSDILGKDLAKFQQPQHPQPSLHAQPPLSPQ